MPIPILATKLYLPPPRPNAILRPRLVERLDAGLHRKLALISAPAGFGKTTLLSQWAAGSERPVAWLSLDKDDSDPTRFLAYFIAALQTVAPELGAGVLRALESPQPPAPEAILTALLNEIALLPGDFTLVLDDYHVPDARPVDQALAYLLEGMPPRMHLVIATREDPHLPLARLRARDQLTELRLADLRFTPSEAADFLNQVTGLDLSADDLAALEARTEGWIAGLQLAAISMQGRQDVAGFIKSFTGSHHFVLDYLVEEVLGRQPESIQAFLLRTSILERLCGPLCDAVLQGDADLPSAPTGQETLEYLERANLFIVPLDDQRYWFRYHHLFAELLRQRLQRISASPAGKDQGSVEALHRRASQWYEDNRLGLEAFRHAALAQDIDRAWRIIEGRGIPLQMLGGVTAILDWLGSLPAAVLDARPWLWARFGSLLLVAGQSTGVEEKLQAAEAALQGAEMDSKNRDLVGQIAAARATLALTRYQAGDIIIQAGRALEYLHPANLPFRLTAIWTLGFAYQLQGDRPAARQAYTEALAISQSCGNVFFTVLATTTLTRMQEMENQLHPAAEGYRRALELIGDPPLPYACEPYLGLARIFYEWNDLEAAERHGQQALDLARQYDRRVDRFIICQVFLARLRLARGDLDGAAAVLAEASESARRGNFVQRMPEVAAAQVDVLLRQGRLAAAADLAQAYDLPLSRARVLLAQGEPSAALSALAALRREMEARGWGDELLKVIVLQAVALQSHKEQAVDLLGEALRLAEPGGLIRTFVDEGPPMARLLSEAAARGIMPGYAAKLLAAFDADAQEGAARPGAPSSQPLIDPLSPRELEVLQLIAQGLSNRAIGERLFLALSTVKGYNRTIFDKLQVESRTAAIVRARQLGLL